MSQIVDAKQAELLRQEYVRNIPTATVLCVHDTLEDVNLNRIPTKRLTHILAVGRNFYLLNSLLQLLPLTPEEVSKVAGLRTYMAHSLAPTPVLMALDEDSEGMPQLACASLRDLRRAAKSVEYFESAEEFVLGTNADLEDKFDYLTK